jgi:hypothetical protein
MGRRRIALARYIHEARIGVGGAGSGGLADRRKRGEVMRIHGEDLSMGGF